MNPRKEDAVVEMPDLCSYSGRPLEVLEETKVGDVIPCPKCGTRIRWYVDPSRIDGYSYIPHYIGEDQDKSYVLCGDPMLAPLYLRLVKKVEAVRVRLGDPQMPGIGGLLVDLEAVSAAFRQALVAITVDAASNLKAKEARHAITQFERSADDYNDQRFRARDARRLKDEENR